MNPLAAHLDNYLKLRRQLGFKLRVPGILLRNFVRFAQQKRVAFITTPLALEWATQPCHISPGQKANRLGVARRFAKYLSAIAPRTEVPAQKLLLRFTIIWDKIIMIMWEQISEIIAIIPEGWKPSFA